MSNATRDRTGLELGAEYEELFFQSEYMRGKDGTTDSDGWYGTVGYTLRGLEASGVPFDMMLAARYEEFDPDTNVPGDAVRGPTVGLSFLFHSHNAKVQLSYTHFDVTGKDEDLAILSCQVAF